MFHRHHSRPTVETPAVPKVRTVRVLRSDEELFAAVERAQAFERRNNRPRIRRNPPGEHPTRPAEDLSLSSPME
jgi:hypothetical protein